MEGGKSLTMTLHEHPKEVRDKVLEALKSGIPKSQVIAEYGVSRRTINRWVKKKSSTKHLKKERCTKLKLLKLENSKLYELLNLVSKRASA